MLEYDRNDIKEFMKELTLISVKKHLADVVYVNFIIF